VIGCDVSLEGLFIRVDFQKIIAMLTTRDQRPS
jgi:hypothetical protein